MQTISVPYKCNDDEREQIVALRRVYGSAVRTAYANALGADGQPLKQKDLRHLVKARFAGGIADAWLIHCATLEGMDLRKARPDGQLVFGTRANLRRRQKGLISNTQWKAVRLRPLTSRGDKLYKGNRHFRLSADGLSCTFLMYGRRIALQLAAMSGNAGEILRQAAALAAEKKINVTFRIDDTRLHVTVDPEDLPDHPQRKRPVSALSCRAIGIDLNPAWIGLSGIENARNVRDLKQTKLLDHTLVTVPTDKELSPETVREMLAAVCSRAIGMARLHRAGVIAVEDGLGKLQARFAGRHMRHKNRVLNFWARTVFVSMLRRKAKLAGIEVVEVPGTHSTLIGNLAFVAPDACAAAAEIARRGLALRADGNAKELLPDLGEGWWANRWKESPLPAEAPDWQELHRGLKAADIGVRRPHPALSPDPDVRSTSDGHAVYRLGHRRRPGRLVCRWIPSPDGTTSRKTVKKSKRHASTVFAG